MRLRGLIAVLGLVLLAACSHAASQTPPRRDLVGEGRAIVEVYCISCHAIGAAGESRLAEAPPFRTLSERYPITALEEAFAEGVLVGHPAMPEFRLEPDQIDALVAYLESIQPRRGG